MLWFVFSSVISLIPCVFPGSSWSPVCLLLVYLGSPLPGQRRGSDVAWWHSWSSFLQSLHWHLNPFWSSTCCRIVRVLLCGKFFLFTSDFFWGWICFYLCALQFLPLAPKPQSTTWALSIPSCFLEWIQHSVTCRQRIPARSELMKPFSAYDFQSGGP